MRGVLTEDPDDFRRRAARFLRTDPIVSGVIVTNVAARRSGAAADPEPAAYVTVETGDGTVVGAAMRTPPFPIFLSPMPPAAVDAMVATLLNACPDAAGVTGPVVEADSFAAEWSLRSGQAATIAMRQRAFRLDAVIEPRSVAGSARLAGERDAELLLAWEDAFGREAEPTATGSSEGEAGRTERHRQRVAARIAEERAFLWEVDGAPVSYVGANVPVADVVRVGPVYTPPEHRGHGYASALVADVSQYALDAGAVACSLFTDLANPTSNKIYQAIGYRPVADVLRYAFGRTS